MNAALRCFFAQLAALALLFSVAAADPFPWTEAEAETGTLRLADGTEVAYRSASILLGDHFEIAIALKWSVAAGPVEQVIVHEMADSPPAVSVQGKIVEVTWTVFPIGADAETVVVTCWRLAETRRAFEEVPCDPSPAKRQHQM